MVQCHTHVVVLGYILEIKCSYKHCDQHPHYISDAKFCLHRVAEAVQLKSTHNYYIQIQGQMAICKKDYCNFVCWTPKGMHVERIAFDASVFSRIKPSLDHYFQSVVLPELLTHAVQDGNVEAEKKHVAAYSPYIYTAFVEKENMDEWLHVIIHIALWNGFTTSV